MRDIENPFVCLNDDNRVNKLEVFPTTIAPHKDLDIADYNF